VSRGAVHLAKILLPEARDVKDAASRLSAVSLWSLDVPGGRRQFPPCLTLLKDPVARVGIPTGPPSSSYAWMCNSAVTIQRLISASSFRPGSRYASLFCGLDRCGYPQFLTGPDPLGQTCRAD
jgi:hypothetical protein